MKNLFTVLAVLTMATIAYGAPGDNPPATKAGAQTNLKTPRDKRSYTVGANIGRGIKAQGADLDPAKIAAGIADAMKGGDLQLTDEEMQKVMEEFQAELQGAMADRAKGMAEKNKKTGEAFLAANKKKPGVVTTKSGLQYQVLKQGKGDRPKGDDTVVAHYAGTLLDGTEFDSSIKRGEPSSFPLNGVIRGWTEALQLMPVGSKWKLFIPSDLAYGPEGRPGIEPNATLVFEVELISIGQPEEAAAPGKAK
jgi:FKBP-type peptidyl-prolyl cis-trans isomerase